MEAAKFLSEISAYKGIVERLQAREEVLLSGIAKALVHDDFRTHLTNALAAQETP